MNKLIECRSLLQFFLLISLAGCGELFLDEQKSLESAQEYLRQHNIHAAAIELRNALKANSDSAEARYLLANINLEYGDFPGAEKEFKRAELAGWSVEQSRLGVARSLVGLARFRELLDGMQPEADWSATARAEMLALRAVSEAGLGNVAGAEQLLGEAFQLAPNTLQVMKVRVQLAMVAGRQEEAQQLLDAAMKVHGENQELLLLHATQLAAGEQPDAARAVYQKVIDMDPPDFVSALGRSARLRLAQMQIMSGELEPAAQLLQSLFRRDPNDPFVNYLGGLIAYEQAQFQRAEELLLKVLKLAPEHNPTRLLFGTVNFAEHNYEQAAYFLGKYLMSVPDNLLARKLLARSYILLGRAEEASAVLQGVVSEETTDTELLTLVGLSDLERGERVAGIAGLEKALKASPGDPAIRSELARAYIESGDAGLAIQELQSMLAEGGATQQTETLLVLAHLRAGESNEAISRVLDMLGREPDNAVIETLAGSVFASSGDRSEARKHLQKALKTEPGLPPALLTLAQIEEVEGNLDVATALYEQLVERDLKSALPMLALARVAEQKKDQQAVASWLERAVEYAPNDIKPRLFLAEFHLRNGHPDLAQPLIGKVLDIAPRETDVLIMMSRILIAQQQYRPAEKTLNDLLAIEPDSVAGHTLLGDVYLQMDRKDDARHELLTALDSNPTGVNVLALLARLEIMAHAYDNAIEYSKRIQVAYPELFLGYDLAGDALVGKTELSGAAQQYELAWERLPSEELAIKRSDIAGRQNNHAAAVGILQEWLGDHPDAARAREFLGNTLQTMGKPELAIEQYELVLQAEPENLVALNNLAGLYQASDRVKALQLAERAWQLASTNPGVQDTYGWLLVQAGQMERGRPLLEKAVKGMGNVPEVRYHYAVALYRTGDQEQGKALLQALLQDEKSFDGRADAEHLLGSE